MSKRLLIALLFVTIPLLARADNLHTWVLQKSTLTYHVSHPVHSADGVSHAAQGKGDCQNGQCNFLVTASVDSFSSGNASRDHHMLKTVRGSRFPVIAVRTALPEAELKSGSILANLEVQFAGNTMEYKNVPFQLVGDGNQIHLTGVIPATLSDFKIPPPKLMLVAIKNPIPISVEMTWEKQQQP